MKILQLNIWGGRLGRVISDLLVRENPDVVCLQEAIAIPGGKSILFEDVEEIQAHTGYEHAYMTPSITFNLMRRKAEWGNCVLSKHPFVETNEQYTYLEHVDDYDHLEISDYNSGRALQHVVVEGDAGPVNILNHHGYHINEHKNGNDETLRQCKLIADYAKSLTGPVVLCGDFNLVATSSSLEQINAVLVNHVKERGVISTRTPLTYKTEACDYIFTSPDIEVKNFQVLDDIVSDHKALTVEF